MVHILIQAGEIKLSAGLNDSETAKAIAGILPVTGTVNTWGEEIYFSIPLHLEQEPGARTEVEAGDLGFWPEGDAFCIFFGPTPVSKNDKPMAYSPVNVFGKVKGDARLLGKLSNGDAIRVILEESS
jgi:hypothetical protein